MKNITNFLQTIITCFLVLILTVLFVIMPDKSFSDKENRTLQKVPQFNIENLSTGKFTEDIGYYYADQFPFRDVFVAVKAYSELLLGKVENNGVIKCGDTLIAKPLKETNRLKENMQIIADFEKNTGVNTVVAALPRSVDVFSELLPKAYPEKQDFLLWKNYFSYAEQFKITSPDLYSPLTKSNEYYHTDHHYTSHGAYTAYNVLGEFLDYKPKAKNNFSIETVTDDFCGTSMRTSGFYLTKKDKIELFRYPLKNSYSVIADGKKINLYDFSKLKTTDSYAVFLGGNHARVDIKNGEDRKKLLIIRDSFADSIAPFLALHFDLTLLDLRYFNDSVQSVVLNENFENVLIFESISELSVNKNLSILNMP